MNKIWRSRSLEYLFTINRQEPSRKQPILVSKEEQSRNTRYIKLGRKRTIGIVVVVFVQGVVVHFDVHQNVFVNAIWKMLIHEHSHLIERDDDRVEALVQKFLFLELQYLHPTKFLN